MNQQETPTSAVLAHDAQTARDGVVSAFLAYFMWGFLPIYFKILHMVTSVEVLAHRIIWAVPFGALIIGWRRQSPEVRAAVMNPRTLALLTLSAAIIAVNWLVYIYAVQNGQIFQASLGYYINPLVYVLVGVLLFGERLSAFQTAAVACAAAGVLVLTISGKQFPLIALTLAISFTVYGVIRKSVAVAAMPGLFVETIVLLPFAGVYLLWLINSSQSAFRADEPVLMLILLLAGPITVLPLLFFALAARRLRLSTLGFLQFIAPTLQFCMGLVYGEVLTTAHMICFALIWLAAGLFIYDVWRRGVRLKPRAG